MKNKLFLVLLVSLIVGLLASCSSESSKIASLEQRMKVIIQKELKNSYGAYRKATCSKVEFIHKKDNDYVGMATVVIPTKTGDNLTVKLNITAVYDGGKHFMYKIVK